MSLDIINNKLIYLLILTQMMFPLSQEASSGTSQMRASASNKLESSVIQIWKEASTSYKEPYRYIRPIKVKDEWTGLFDTKKITRNRGLWMKRAKVESDDDPNFKDKLLQLIGEDIVAHMLNTNISVSANIEAYIEKYDILPTKLLINITQNLWFKYNKCLDGVTDILIASMCPIPKTTGSDNLEVLINFTKECVNNNVLVLINDFPIDSLLLIDPENSENTIKQIIKLLSTEESDKLCTQLNRIVNDIMIFQRKKWSDICYNKVALKLDTLKAVIKETKQTNISQSDWQSKIKQIESDYVSRSNKRKDIIFLVAICTLRSRGMKYNLNYIIINEYQRILW